MKKIVALAISSAIIFTACTNKKEVEEAQQQANASKAELVAAVADRDQLLNLVGEISQDMEQIKQLENILTVNAGTETPSQKDQIKADIAAIQKTLEERRKETLGIQYFELYSEKHYRPASYTTRFPDCRNQQPPHKPR